MFLRNSDGQSTLVKIGITLSIITLTVVLDSCCARMPRRQMLRGWNGCDIDLNLCPTSDKVPMLTFSSNRDLICLAAYPIRMTSSDKAFNSMVGMANATPLDSSAGCYFVGIPFYDQYTGASGFNGNYVCSSISDPTKFNSTYLFPEENGLQRGFISTKNNVVLVNKYNTTKLRIPCLTATKNLTNPILMQIDQVSNVMMNVITQHKWATHYNQSTGFDVTFPVTKIANESELIGKYFCRDPETLKDIQFRVAHADFIVNPSSPKLTFDKGTLVVECYSGSPVYIKALNYSSPIPILENISHLNGSISTDKVMYGAGYTYYAKATFESSDPKAQGAIICINSSSEQTLFTWTFDNDYICQCNWTTPETQRYYPTDYEQTEFGDYDHQHLRQTDDYHTTHYFSPYYSGVLTCGVEKSTSVSVQFFLCDNPIDCYNLKVLNKQQTGQKGSRGSVGFHRDLGWNSHGWSNIEESKYLKSYIELQSGQIQCVADGYSSRIDVQVDLNKTMYFNQEPQDKYQIEIRLYEKSFFDGDKAKFTCISLSYNIIPPLLWAIEYVNGSMEFIHYNGTTQNYGNFEDYLSVHKQAMSRLTVLTMKKNAKTVYCYAKKWNSSEWASASVNVKVQDVPIAQDPPPCPRDSKSSAIIINRKLLRYGGIQEQKQRLPRLITGKDLEIYSPIVTLNLFCFSNLPVEWIKDGEKISTFKHTKASCRNGDNSISKNKLYKISTKVVVLSTNGTGNYTCRPSTSHYSYEVSTYLYMIGRNQTTFVNEGHHYQVVHKVKSPELAEQANWARIPCRTNQPNFIPFIFIDRPDGKLERVGLDNAYIQFDPKTGFLIDVTVNFIKNDTTIFLCSDSRDGSFIGNLVTLHLVYDPVPTTTPLPTVAPTTIPTTNATVPPPMNHTTKTPETIVADTGSSAGFIVCIVLLLSLCVASFMITYKLYQKLTNEKKSNPSSTSHELDWASAVKHSSDSVVGNNVGNLIEATNNYNTNNGCENDNYQDESMPHIAENDFHYKKF